MMLSFRRVTWAAEGARDARRVWPERQSLLVRLSAPGGSFGIGEASPLPGYSPDSLVGAEQALAAVNEPDAAVALVNAIAALSHAASHGSASHGSASHGSASHGSASPDTHDTVLAALAAVAALVPATFPSARLALETAALDLVGKQLGLPAWAVLRASTSRHLRDIPEQGDARELHGAPTRAALSRADGEAPDVSPARQRSVRVELEREPGAERLLQSDSPTRDLGPEPRLPAAALLHTSTIAATPLDSELSPERELSALAGAATARDLVETALSITQKGYRCIKLKLGAPGQCRAEVAAVAALRERLGQHVRIRLDANGAWSETETAEAWATLRQLDIELFEEPGQLPAELHGALPLGLDESLQGLSVAEAVRRLRASAARYCVLKPTALGGLAHCLSLAHAAAELGVTAVVSHTFDGPFAWRAAGALALTLLRGAAHGLAPHAALDGWRPAPLPVRAGTLYGWSEPGMGDPAEHGF